MGSTGSRPPWVTVAVLGMVLTFAAVIILTGHAEGGVGQTLILTTGTALPSLLAAGYAERASRKADAITDKIEETSDGKA